MKQINYVPLEWASKWVHTKTSEFELYFDARKRKGLHSKHWGSYILSLMFQHVLKPLNFSDANAAECYWMTLIWLIHSKGTPHSTIKDKTYMHKYLYLFQNKNMSVACVRLSNFLNAGKPTAPNEMDYKLIYAVANWRGREICSFDCNILSLNSHPTGGNKSKS